MNITMSPCPIIEQLVISKRNTIHFMNGGGEKQVIPNKNSTPTSTVCFSTRCSSLAIMFHSKTYGFSKHRSSHTWSKTYSFIAIVKKQSFFQEFSFNYQKNRAITFLFEHLQQFLQLMYRYFLETTLKNFKVFSSAIVAG